MAASLRLALLIGLEGAFLARFLGRTWRPLGGKRRRRAGRTQGMGNASARRRRQLWPPPSWGRPPSRDRRTATGSSIPPSASRPSHSLPWSTPRLAAWRSTLLGRSVIVAAPYNIDQDIGA